MIGGDGISDEQKIRPFLAKLLAEESVDEEVKRMRIKEFLLNAELDMDVEIRFLKDKIDEVRTLQVKAKNQAVKETNSAFKGVVVQPYESELDKLLYLRRKEMDRAKSAAAERKGGSERRNRSETKSQPKFRRYERKEDRQSTKESMNIQDRNGGQEGSISLPLYEPTL